MVPITLITGNRVLAHTSVTITCTGVSAWLLLQP